MTHEACIHRLTALLVSAMSFATPCAAQCFEWDTTIGNPGVDQTTFPLEASIRAAAVYDGGVGPRLFLGGRFDSAGGAAVTHLARWDGAGWSAVANITGLNPLDGTVTALAVFDDGTSRTLIVSGFFTHIDGLPIRNIAAWNGTTWSALGTGLDSAASALATFDDGSGPALYVGGSFTDAGGVPANGIAKWDGTSWSAVTTGAGFVSDLCALDDGTGPALYAAGWVAGITGIARFDGTTWSSLGVGPDPAISCLAAYDDGAGAAVYAGGRFDVLGGVAAKNIAKWTGSAWAALGAGLPGPVTSNVAVLTVWNDGFGPKLVAGGTFSMGSISAWNGSQWKPLRTGVTLAGSPGDPPGSTGAGTVNVLAAYDEGPGAGDELFAAGRFDTVDRLSTQCIARYGACLPIGQPYCFGDGSLPTPCPCELPNTVPNPSGGSDGGCANSFIASGAKLVASGTTNPDTARLLVRDATPIGFGFFISGNASDESGVAAADGVRCAGGAFVRFGGQNALGGFLRYPAPYAGWSNSLSQISSVVPGGGVTKHYQLVYRNATLGFCNSSTLNWTNAVTLIW